MELAWSDDLENLAQRITDEYQSVERHTASAVIHAARTGLLLKAAKMQIEGHRGYGAWGLWCAANLPFSARTAQFYMQLATAHPSLADPDTDIEQLLYESAVAREFAGLSLRQAMRMLAEPKVRPLPAATDGATEAGSEQLATDELQVLEQNARELTGGWHGLTRDQQQVMIMAFSRQKATREQTGYMLGWADCLRALGMLGKK